MFRDALAPHRIRLVNLFFAAAFMAIAITALSGASATDTTVAVAGAGLIALGAAGIAGAIERVSRDPNG